MHRRIPDGATDAVTPITTPVASPRERPPPPLSDHLTAIAERIAHAHLIGVEILRIYRPIVHTDGDATHTHARAVAQGASGFFFAREYPPLEF